MTSRPDYRMRLPANVALRASWAMIALLLCALVSLVLVGLTMLLAFDRGASEWMMFVYWAIVDWFSIIIVATLVILIVWLWGAHANLEALGRSSRFRRGATVYWWLIPIANLFMPYRVVADVRAQMLSGGDDGQRGPDPVLWWWCLLVFGVVTYLVSVQFDADPGQFSWPLVLEAISSAALVLAAYFGIRLVNRITGLQIE